MLVWDAASLEPVETIIPVDDPGATILALDWNAMSVAVATPAIATSGGVATRLRRIDLGSRAVLGEIVVDANPRIGVAGAADLTFSPDGR